MTLRDGDRDTWGHGEGTVSTRPARPQLHLGRPPPGRGHLRVCDLSHFVTATSAKPRDLRRLFHMSTRNHNTARDPEFCLTSSYGFNKSHQTGRGCTPCAWGCHPHRSHCVCPFSRHTGHRTGLGSHVARAGMEGAACHSLCCLDLCPAEQDSPWGHLAPGDRHRTHRADGPP